MQPRRHEDTKGQKEIFFFGDGLAVERELQQLLFESNDAREGIAANLEKRKPVFDGT
jgi:enoyl-CoA hydratase/carnithine racemase